MTLAKNIVKKIKKNGPMTARARAVIKAYRRTKAGNKSKGSIKKKCPKKWKQSKKGGGVSAGDQKVTIQNVDLS